MKIIKKEVEVFACEICGKELNTSTHQENAFFRITEPSKHFLPPEEYNFHRECVDKELIKIAKANK
ncbi:MAG: hypothetical protein OEV44_01125 [Spirochaetota bacterium]|nr:hypothetical protein [Spirochaetota bacterium]